MAGLTPVSTQWFECTVFLGKEIFGRGKKKNLMRISSPHFPSVGQESAVHTRSSSARDNKVTVEGIGGDGWKRRLCAPGLASVYSTEKVGQWYTGPLGKRVLAFWGQKHDPSFQSKGM